MKLVGILGSGSGKLGSSVFSTVAGETVVRQYQPTVANPNTEAQVNQRARMKLMSQIAASLAPVIAIPKDGLKSSRNLFIKKNFDASSANDGVAQITIENVQLTSGNAGLPAIEITRSLATGLTVRLAERADGAVTRVVYIAYSKTSEQTLQYMQSIIVESAGADGTFPGSMIYLAGDVVVFAYGMKDLNAKATAKYANYSVGNGEDLARLVLTRNISLQDYQFTRTRGTTLFAGEDSSVTVGDNEARVFVTASGNGTVSGAGVFALGTQVTVTATPAEGNHFVAWRLNGSTTNLSTSASYTFTLQQITDLVAVFASDTQTEQYTVTVSANPAAQGTASGGGTVDAGQSVTVTATAAQSGWKFDGWKKNGSGSVVSNQLSYTFIPTEDCEMVASYSTDDYGV